MADVVEHINKDEIVDLAYKLIKIPSFTGKETSVAEFRQDFFERNDFETEMQEVQPGRKQLIAKLKEGRNEGI